MCATVRFMLGSPNTGQTRAVRVALVCPCHIHAVTRKQTLEDQRSHYMHTVHRLYNPLRTCHTTPQTVYLIDLIVSHVYCRACPSTTQHSVRCANPVRKHHACIPRRHYLVSSCQSVLAHGQAPCLQAPSRPGLYKLPRAHLQAQDQTLVTGARAHPSLEFHLMLSPPIPLPV